MTSGNSSRYAFAFCTCFSSGEASDFSISDKSNSHTAFASTYACNAVAALCSICALVGAATARDGSGAAGDRGVAGPDLPGHTGWALAGRLSATSTGLFVSPPVVAGAGGGRGNDVSTLILFPSQASCLIGPGPCQAPCFANT